MSLSLYDPTADVRPLPPRVTAPIKTKEPPPPDKLPRSPRMTRSGIERLEGIEKGYSPWANIEALHQKMAPLFVLDGPLEFPLVRRSGKAIKDPPTSMVPFTGPTEIWEDAAVHFFRNDYRFECIWNNPERYGKRFKQAKVKYVLTPDFSLFTRWPTAMQIWNTYRNRWVGAYFQYLGLNVIPSVSWADPTSYAFCFQGLQRGGAVATATAGSMKTWKERDGFEHGFNAMIEALEPSHVLIYGRLWFTPTIKCTEFPRLRDNGRPE